MGVRSKVVDGLLKQRDQVVSASNKIMGDIKGIGNSRFVGTPSSRSIDPSKVKMGDKLSERISSYKNAADHMSNGRYIKDDRTSFMGDWAGANISKSAKAEGRTVMGAMGAHAVRGAVWGGLGGGTLEAAQGGSFWDGAKSGAFNGAVGWTGYRMGMRATGATSLNPFSKQGAFKQGAAMYNSTSKNAKVSKQASAILNNNQTAGLAQAYVLRGGK